MKTLQEIMTFKQHNDQENRQENNAENTHLDMLFHYQNHDNNSNEEKTHLIDYATDSSAINRHLWDKHSGLTNQIDDSSYERHIKILDSALKAYKTPQKLTVWSGLRHDPRPKMNSEGIVHHPSYISTSLHKGQADGFASHNINDIIKEKHLLKVHVPKGHHGSYLPDLSSEPHEREFLLPRGLNFKIHKHTTKMIKGSQSFVKDSIIHTHHATIVQGEDK